MNRRARQIITVALALLGLEFWRWFMQGMGAGKPQRIILIAAAVLALIAPLNRRLDNYVRRFDAWLAAHRGIAAVAIGALVFGYFSLQAWRYSELLIPTVHDEHAYLIQAHMLARGRLWHAPYPPQVSKFFDAFYLILDRVYAAEYFPGTALLMVPAIWLGLPFWITPMLEATISAALLFLVLSQILAEAPAPGAAPIPGHVRALVAVIMLTSLNFFTKVALMPLSQGAFLMVELLLLWSWLRWRRNRGAGWTILIGAVGGFAAIIRPLDALCFAIPVGLAMIVELLHSSLARRPVVRAVALVILGALPFLALQVIQDVGITGKWYQYPENLDYSANYPAPIIGFYHIDPRTLPRPASLTRRLWLKWVLDEYYLKHDIHHPSLWFPQRCRDTLADTLPNVMLVVLLPLGLISLRGVRRWVIFGSMLLFMLAYTAYVFHLEHYQVVIMPAMIMLVLLGWQSLDDAWPAARRAIDAFLLPALVGVSVLAFEGFDRNIQPFMPNVAEQWASDQFLAKLPHMPAVVLFRFDPNVSTFHNELIYNDQVSWPDDAPVVRASDLGEGENWELYDYYAQHQPDRYFYIYDRGAIYHNIDPLIPLGTARALAAAHQQSRSR